MAAQHPPKHGSLQREEVVLLSEDSSLMMRVNHAVEPLGVRVRIVPAMDIDTVKIEADTVCLADATHAPSPVDWAVFEEMGRSRPLIYLVRDPANIPGNVPAGARIIGRAFTSTHLKSAVASVIEELEARRSHYKTDGELVYASGAMARVVEDAAAYADSANPVLIHGDTGVGKELIAKRLHERNPGAAKGPFVAVNCGAIPEQLFESEFFGHVRGAFTGAVHTHKGFFEQANGGTLFLDEIGELARHQQVKLLRAIESRAITPVGAEHAIKVSFRLIAATNRDLRVMIDQGLFRADLFYRLAVIELHIPNLDERGGADKIAIFSDAIAKGSAGSVQAADIPAWVITLVANASFPGNVRQLKNLAERISVIVQRKGQWDPAEIRQAFQLNNGPRRDTARRHAPVPQPEERNLIIRALRNAGWRREQAAQALGISRTSLWKKMRKHEIADNEPTIPGVME